MTVHINKPASIDAHPTFATVTDRALRARPVPEVGTIGISNAVRLDRETTMVTARQICVTVVGSDCDEETGTVYLKLEVAPDSVRHLAEYDLGHYRGAGFIIRTMVAWFETEAEYNRREHYLKIRNRMNRPKVPALSWSHVTA